MRLARETGLGREGLLNGKELVSAVEDGIDWMERGPTRRAEGGMVAMHVVQIWMAAAGGGSGVGGGSGTRRRAVDRADRNDVPGSDQFSGGWDLLGMMPYRER